MYKLMKHINGEDIPMVMRVEDRAFIPKDPANTDYQAYLQWLEEGNKPSPPDEPLQEQ